MSKPSYLGLLNAISLGEQRGYELLTAWADCTKRADVRETLAFVALREREHAAAFAKRIAELGYAVQEREDEKFERRLKKAGSKKLRDRRKFEKVLGYGPNAAEGVAFERFFEDESIDPHTGALLGRFIAEERDSGRRLQACYAALVAEEGGDEEEDDELLADLADRLDRLTVTLSDLKALRRSS